MWTGRMTRVLIGGVGYRNLRDHSFGVVLVDALAAVRVAAWRVLSKTSVTTRSRSCSGSRTSRSTAASSLPLSSARCSGRAGCPERCRCIGGTTCFQARTTSTRRSPRPSRGSSRSTTRWSSPATSRRCPPTVVVVEIEPDAHEFGSSLTPAVDAALVEARELVTQLALEPATAARVPAGSLAADSSPSHRRGLRTGD